MEKEKLVPFKFVEKVLTDAYNAILHYAPTPVDSKPDGVKGPAQTASQALDYAAKGVALDGVTVAAQGALLEARKAAVISWWSHPNLIGIEDARKEYEILTGGIDDIGPFSVPTGNPRPKVDCSAPLQAIVDAYLKRDPNKGPGIV